MFVHETCVIATIFTGIQYILHNYIMVLILYLFVVFGGNKVFTYVCLIFLIILFIRKYSLNLNDIIVNEHEPYNLCEYNGNKIICVS